MDKDLERNFVAALSRALVSLPFDLKVLLEGVADADLEQGVRELAAATVVHIITPRDGNVEPYLRHAEDVILLRLALRRILTEGGDGAGAFRDRFAESFARMEEELGLFERACGADTLRWLDGKWPTLLKGVYAKKKISVLVEDEAVGTFLYDEGLRFGTDYAISENSLAGRLKQAQPVIDHLVRKREQDKRKITQF